MQIAGRFRASLGYGQACLGVSLLTGVERANTASASGTRTMVRSAVKVL